MNGKAKVNEHCRNLIIKRCWFDLQYSLARPGLTEYFIFFLDIDTNHYCYLAKLWETESRLTNLSFSMFCNMFNFTIVFSILVTSLQMLSSAQRLIYLYEQEIQKANFGKFSAALFTGTKVLIQFACLF